MHFYLEFVYLYYEKEIYLEVPRSRSSRVRPDLLPFHLEKSRSSFLG